MKKYYSPHSTVIESDCSCIICASTTRNPVKNNSKLGTTSNNSISNVYSSMTKCQKLAAMNLMVVFGGSCSGTPQELNKINHIMSVEGQKMGVSGAEVHASHDQFPEMQDMVNAIKNVDKSVLEKLFWAYYCIIAVGKSREAVSVLLGVYRELGFTDDQCIAILQRNTGHI